MCPYSVVVLQLDFPRQWFICNLDRVKRIWYLSPMRAAKVQASLRIRAVSPEPSLLAHTSSESRGTFRQKARSLAPLNGWACAVKICHDGMFEDTNSLDGAHLIILWLHVVTCWNAMSITVFILVKIFFPFISNFLIIVLMVFCAYICIWSFRLMLRARLVSDCRFGVSPVNYPDPEAVIIVMASA